jgi:hypothetical protein
MPYLAGGFRPGPRRDAAAWSVGADLFLFGGSLTAEEVAPLTSKSDAPLPTSFNVTWEAPSSGQAGPVRRRASPQQPRAAPFGRTPRLSILLCAGQGGARRRGRGRQQGGVGAAGRGVQHDRGGARGRRRAHDHGEPRRAAAAAGRDPLGPRRRRADADAGRGLHPRPVAPAAAFGVGAGRVGQRGGRAGRAGVAGGARGGHVVDGRQRRRLPFRRLRCAPFPSPGTPPRDHSDAADRTAAARFSHGDGPRG